MSHGIRLEMLFEQAELHNSNHRGHWTIPARKRAAMRRHAGNIAQAAVRAHGPIPGPVTLTITFDFPNQRRRDLDNIEVKGLIDGIVDAGLVTDDNADTIVAVTRTRGDRPTPPKMTRITVDIEQVRA